MCVILIYIINNSITHIILWLIIYKLRYICIYVCLYWIYEVDWILFITI